MNQQEQNAPKTPEKEVRPAPSRANNDRTNAKKKPRFEINPEASFTVMEAYKALRTNITFSIPGKGCKSFLVTSCIASEGKTTTASSLALTIAQTNARVIIIDGDLRRPKVHSKFRLTNKLGLSNVLSGMCTLDEAIQRVGTLSLDLLSSGTIPPNPAELLSSDAMASLIAELKKHYDFVIVDTPPVNIVSDALPLTKLVDGVVMVTRYQQSTYPEVQAGISRLEFVGARILGLVFNGVQDASSHGKGYSRRRYGYGYGSSYGYASSKYEYAYRSADQTQFAQTDPNIADDHTV